MTEFAEFLQARILERPVVDQTGLTDRYDFTLEWKPDTVHRREARSPTRRLCRRTSRIGPT